MPTQMGKMAFPLVSFSTTMGMLLTGSIIKPRIFISTSIWSPFSLDVHDCFAGQRIRTRARDPNIRKLPDQCLAVLWTCLFRMNEVESAILCCPADPLTRGLIIPLHEGLLGGSHQLGIAADLDGALLLLQDGQAPGLFFFRDLIFQRQRG